MKNFVLAVCAVVLVLSSEAGATTARKEDDRDRANEMLAKIGDHMGRHLRSSAAKGGHAHHSTANVMRSAHQKEAVMLSEEDSMKRAAQTTHMRRLAEQIGEHHLKRRSAGHTGERPAQSLLEAHASHHSQTTRNHAGGKVPGTADQLHAVHAAVRDAAHNWNSMERVHAGAGGAARAAHESHAATRKNGHSAPTKMHNAGASTHHLAHSLKGAAPGMRFHPSPSNKADDGQE